MGVALILHVLTFLLIMGPIFFDNYSFFSTETSFNYVQTTWLHAIPGVIALSIGNYILFLDGQLTLQISADALNGKESWI